MSPWEREIIAEHAREAMRHKQAQGEYRGDHAPYGFELINGELVKEDVEQEGIRHA